MSCRLLDRVQAEGERIGIEKAQFNALKNVINQLKISENEAMDVLKIPESEREKYRERLEKQDNKTHFTGA